MSLEVSNYLFFTNSLDLISNPFFLIFIFCSLINFKYCLACSVGSQERRRKINNSLIMKLKKKYIVIKTFSFLGKRSWWGNPWKKWVWSTGLTGRKVLLKGTRNNHWFLPRLPWLFDYSKRGNNTNGSGFHVFLWENSNNRYL